MPLKMSFNKKHMSQDVKVHTMCKNRLLYIVILRNESYMLTWLKFDSHGKHATATRFLVKQLDDSFADSVTQDDTYYVCLCS